MDEQARQEIYNGLVLQKMQKINGLDVQIHAQDWTAVSNTALALLDLDNQLRAHERTAPELADAE